MFIEIRFIKDRVFVCISNSRSKEQASCLFFVYSTTATNSEDFQEKFYSQDYRYETK